ncbi:carboxypeptidase M-like [Brienomyrus brachyistius]|uniref:carboxypeptidase M-like n=1 Tax=Brienomyrus brachyistius TaxID=42636 RepID=UPI0020B44106|nr:carboxypeptidase M-like [Brienomyrus brachyistius]
MGRLWLLGLLFGASLWLIPGLQFRYHNTVEMEQYLKSVIKNYPSFTHLHSIGKSVEGRELWVLVLGKFPTEHKPGIPEFRYVANMHGNEVVGRVLLLQLIEHLVKNYLRDPLVTLLLNSSRIHILPSMNPDGFEAAVPGCLRTKGRYNKHRVDLNRNFPDAFSRGKEQTREPEVQAVMDWLHSEPFVLSANLHGGAIVASYPYDNSNKGIELQGGASITPDDDVFVHLAKTYSFSHTLMHMGKPCQGSTGFQDGITNGYRWVPGGMQDYNYIWGQCFEVTLELSCCKYPSEKMLPGLWAENKAALLAYMQQIHLGVKGQVLDANRLPVANALVEVLGRKNQYPFKTNHNGEFYRLLLPGNYTLKVTVEGQAPMIETLSIPYGPDRFSALIHNFVLPGRRRDPDTVVPTDSGNAKESHFTPIHGASLLSRYLTTLLILVLCPELL